MSKDIEKDWVVQFINLPPKDQVDFLFRHSLETEIRKEVERRVFSKTN